MSEAFQETAVVLHCEGEELIGITATPYSAAPKPIGVVIVVGGPQYRAGSHRQFTLLSRHAAGAGYCTLRFDVRGMGDSSGAARTFEDIAADIRIAVDRLMADHPQLHGVALWGLCDAASAAMMYAPTDARVLGLALVNPWARGEQTFAQAQLKYYYVRRLLSADFWRKLVSGRFSARQASRDLRDNIGRATFSARASGNDYRSRMVEGMLGFNGSTLLVIAGQDLTAAEFQLYVDSNTSLQGRLARSDVRRVEVLEADHTFSRAAWQQRLETSTLDWLDALCV